MRTYSLLIVAAVALSAYANASSARSSLTFERPTLSHQHGPLRFLRDGTEEERAPFDFPGKVLQVTDKIGLTSYETRFPKKHLPSIPLNDVLENKKFIKYVKKMRGNKKIDSYASIAEVLANHYTDDEFLKMLKTSTEDSNTKDAAIKLQDGWIQFKTTKIEGEPTDEVINHVRDLLIPDDNLLRRFEAYEKLMKRKYEGDVDDLMVLDLIHCFKYNYDALTTMLTNSMEKPDTKDIATRINNMFAQKSPDNMFTLLNSKIHGNNVLSTRDFKFWVKHATDYYRKAPEEVMWMKMAHDMASYDDDKLLKMLETFTKDPATKDAAIKLQDGWIQFKTTKIEGEPDRKVTNHVLMLITLDDNVLKSSRFEAFYKLIKRKYKGDVVDSIIMHSLVLRYPNTDAVLEMLEKSIEDPATKDIATRIQEKLNVWMTSL